MLEVKTKHQFSSSVLSFRKIKKKEKNRKDVCQKGEGEMCHTAEHLKICFCYQKVPGCSAGVHNDGEKYKDHKTHKME